MDSKTDLSMPPPCRQTFLPHTNPWIRRIHVGKAFGKQNELLQQAPPVRSHRPLRIKQQGDREHWRRGPPTGHKNWWREYPLVPEYVNCLKEGQKKAACASLTILNEWLTAIMKISALAENSSQPCETSRKSSLSQTRHRQIWRITLLMPNPQLNAPRKPVLALLAAPILQLHSTALVPWSQTTMRQFLLAPSTILTDTWTLCPRQRPNKGMFSTTSFPTTSGWQPPTPPLSPK